MSAIITPTEIDDMVLSFCRQISQSEPYYVEIVPEPSAKPLFCFPNVYEAIKKKGGECLYGWQISLHPGVFIEAIFHGVWKKPDSNIVDITPRSNSEQNILFLPDPQKVYENKQVNNIRQPLTRNGLIPHFFSTFDALFSINNFGNRENEMNIMFTGEEAEIIEWLLDSQMALENMIKAGMSKNSRCTCGSGIKYKRCCGQSFESNMQILKSRYAF